MLKVKIFWKGQGVREGFMKIEKVITLTFSLTLMSFLLSPVHAGVVGSSGGSISNTGRITTTGHKRSGAGYTNTMDVVKNGGESNQ